MSWGPFGLDDRVAVVTGGAQGIGFGVASRMVEAGARVVLADLNGDAAAHAATRLDDGSGRAVGIRADVSDPAAGDHVVAGAVDRFGRIDILVNNAGIFPMAPLAEVTHEFVQRLLGVNLAGVIYVTKAVAASMAATGGGAVVNIASIDGIHPSFPGLSTYGASKGGVIALTRHHALELAPSGIRVNAIAPGGILTEGAAATSDGGGISEDERQALEASILARIPLGRFGTPDDIATAAVFLASPASSYMTGEIITVEGGILLS